MLKKFWERTALNTIRCSLFIIAALNTLIVSEALAQPASDPLVVVSNNQSTIDALAKKQVVDIYMGRQVKLSNGERAVALDYESGLMKREVFYRQLVGMEINRINAYWSRLLFSGRAQPPLKFRSVEEMISALKDNPNAIAYMPQSMVPSDFRTVYAFQEEGLN